MAQNYYMFDELVYPYFFTFGCPLEAGYLVGGPLGVLAVIIVLAGGYMYYRLIGYMLVLGGVVLGAYAVKQ